MKIHVTIDDIARGRRGSMDMCPVAFALARAFDLGVNCVRAFPDEIKLYAGWCQVFKRPTPALVQTWIEKYDRGDRVSPFEFNL